MTDRWTHIHRPYNSQPRHWEHRPDVFGSVEDISDALIIREKDEFLLTDAAGNVPAGNHRGLGLYSRDARHLSEYDFLLDGEPPMTLLSTADSGFSQEQVLGNRRSVQGDQVVGRCTVEVRRERVLSSHLEERLRITNFNVFPVTVHPSYSFAADFADIFEVRGHERRALGSLSAPEVARRTIRYRYLGVDGVWRSTTIVFDQEPESIDDTGASFAVSLAPRESAELFLRVLVDERVLPERPEAVQQLRSDYRNWRESFAGFHSDNESFNRLIDRSLTDLRMLWTPERAGHSYLAAGTPWFAALFGRDSIIASLQTLPFRPDIARECLYLLMRYQGQVVDPYRSEQPGKILHEMRQNELSRVNELPYERYYGSVDSTPLFLLLAAEYFHWTADTDTLRDLLPAIIAALHWVHYYGDSDGDGFVDYVTDSVGGLRNQGWKDSDEAIVHEDGSLCSGTIALAEVQGYVYQAFRRLAPLFDALGDPQRAVELKRLAAALRRRFLRSFWLREQGLLAMSLDGEGRPAAVMSSNAGQVLFSGILDRGHATAVRDGLFRNSMFSGWGIRTLSSDAKGYYPLGYHVGTVWPHDNGIIALGLKRYGFDDEVTEIATGLFDAAREFPSYRLPELFGGQPRSEFEPPVPYPVACRPQTWTAGAQLHLLQAMFGLHADGARGCLKVVRPRLPFWMDQVHISGLRVGAGRVNLHFTARRGRTYVSYDASEGVRVEFSQSPGSFFS